jgi:glycosyltransferase involved in cell wall biosynthesis
MDSATEETTHVGTPSGRGPGGGDGVNVVGYLSAEAGIGEAARRMIEGLRSAGISVAAMNYTKGSPSRQGHPLDGVESLLTDAPVYDVNLICINAEDFDGFAYDVGPDIFRGRWSIGFWWWELPRFPARYRRALSLLDEIWVGSEHVADAIRAATSKPVVTIPLPLSFEPPPALTRADLGLPEGFMFLFSFDFYGIFERKNPLAVVEAFKQAFPPGDDPLLVVKSINGEKHRQHAHRLQDASRDRPDILLLDRYLSLDEKAALTALCDCYVSLHRAEGFGLTIAEAMARAKPVIATGYSGNLAFTDAANSYLVPFRLSVTPEGCAPYPPGVEWAEPDIGEAARAMRHVHESRDDATIRGLLAQARILEAHSVERAGEFIANRLDRARSLRRRDSGETDAGWLEAVVGGALDRVSSQAGAADEYLLSAPTRFGRPVSVLRRLSWRLLWPYFFRERTLNASFAQALGGVLRAQQDQARRLAALEQQSGFSAESDLNPKRHEEAPKRLP